MYYIFFAIKQKENKELSKDIFRVFQHKLSCHVPSVDSCISKDGYIPITARGQVTKIRFVALFWSLGLGTGVAQYGGGGKEETTSQKLFRGAHPESEETIRPDRLAEGWLGLKCGLGSRPLPGKSMQQKEGESCCDDWLRRPWGTNSTKRTKNIRKRWRTE